MEKEIIYVDGMSCSHCEKAVIKAVGSLAGVNSVIVDLVEKTATVEFDASKIQLGKIKEGIEELGYDVV